MTKGSAVVFSPDEINEKMALAEGATRHRFQNRALLLEAITHRSYANEVRGQNLRDNDRLEYVGDSVLDLLVAGMIYTSFPELDSGQMTKLRAALVNTIELADIAGGLSLGNALLLGRGEILSGGAQKASVLADAYEALVGALYLDQGLDAVRIMINDEFKRRMKRHNRVLNALDTKSLLQETCAKRHWELPVYKVIDRNGPDHETVYTVSCRIGKDIVATGEGRSKKLAEQDVAGILLDRLNGETDET